MIEYDGYEFESPVDRARIERIADICALSSRMAAAGCLPATECLDELNSCLYDLLALSGPLFPPLAEGGIVGDEIMVDGVVYPFDGHLVIPVLEGAIND